MIQLLFFRLFIVVSLISITLTSTSSDSSDFDSFPDFLPLLLQFFGCWLRQGRTQGLVIYVNSTTEQCNVTERIKYQTFAVLLDFISFRFDCLIPFLFSISFSCPARVLCIVFGDPWSRWLVVLAIAGGKEEGNNKF